MDYPANVQRLSLFALSGCNSIRGHIRPTASHPSSGEIAQDFVLRNGVLLSAPRHVTRSVTRDQLSRNQTPVEIGPGHVNGLSVVLTAGIRPRRDLAIPGGDPAQPRVVAAVANQGSCHRGSPHRASSGLLDDPRPVGPPSGADAHVLDGDALVVGPVEEWSGVAFVTDGDAAVLPADPEAAEFVAVQVAGCVGFGHVGFAAVLADYRLGIAPAADEDFVHRSCLRRGRTEGDVGIVRGAHSELQQSRSVGKEGVLEFVLGLQFCKKKIT
jgi:hypothetical protein